MKLLERTSEKNGIKKASHKNQGKTGKNSGKRRC